MDEYVLKSMQEQLASPNEEVRRSVVNALSNNCSPDAKHLILEALGDESWRIRKEALDSLFSCDIEENDIDKIAEMLRSSDNAGKRNSACEALERLGDRALKVLFKYIEDTDCDVRKFVIDVLGNIESKESVPYLIKALNDPDPNVSSAAAENLGKIGAEEAVPSLLKVLDPENVPLCYTILEALGRVGRHVQIDSLITLADRPLLKKPVFDCLGSIGDPDAVRTLIQGVREKARHVRAAATDAIVKIRGGVASVEKRKIDDQLRELADTEFCDDLFALLSVSGKQPSDSMVKILGLIGDPRASRLLLEVCRDDRTRSTSLQAFRDLGSAGISRLLEMYPDSDDEHRCYIVYICGELKIAESKEILRKAMNDPCHVLRRVAATAAGSIAVVDLIVDLEALLDDEEMDVRVGSVDSLARLAALDPESVNVIAEKLSMDPLPERRRSAATLYAALQSVDRLARLVKDENPTVRKSAVFALAELKSPATVNHLVLALVDEEADIRGAAAGALGSIGGEQAEKALLLTLRDQNQWVRCAALRSIGALKFLAAEEQIVELIPHAEGLVLIEAFKTMMILNPDRAHNIAVSSLDDNDKEVVKAAIEILAVTGDNWLEDQSERLLNHEAWDVRSLFIKALAERRGVGALPLLMKALTLETDDLVRKQISETVRELS